MAKRLLLGLGPRNTEELGRTLRQLGHRPISAESRCIISRVDAIFCDGDDGRCGAVIEDLRRRTPGIPVVVVTRIPEASKWIDALEAGAADYCSAPFEATQVKWILDTVLTPGSAGAGARAPAA